jgi:hypothetical protein
MASNYRPSVFHMGKMQTAAEDAYKHRDQYDVVVWAVTESDVTLISSYVDPARLRTMRASVRSMHWSRRATSRVMRQAPPP